MANPYINYYVEQAGSGIAGFEGIRYQKGHGIFGNVLKFLKPALKFLGKHALRTGLDVASGVMDNGDIKNIATKRLKQGLRNMGTEAINIGQKYSEQQGKGRRRRRKRQLRRNTKNNLIRKRKYKKRKRKSIFD